MCYASVELPNYRHSHPSHSVAEILLHRARGGGVENVAGCFSASSDLASIIWTPSTLDIFAASLLADVTSRDRQEQQHQSGHEDQHNYSHFLRHRFPRVVLLLGEPNSDFQPGITS
jgi:hypothetical protein